MPPPLSDDELRTWAREHLVYEARMLAYTAVRLSQLADQSRSMESNALLESFAVHVRCLRDFFYGQRGWHEMDAFASDFLPENAFRPDVPAALAEIDDRNRLSREVVHLSYERRDVAPEVKDWPISEIVAELVAAINTFADRALPERLDAETHEVLTDLEQAPPPGVGPISVASAIARPYGGGTISLPDFSIGS